MHGCQLPRRHSTKVIRVMQDYDTAALIATRSNRRRGAQGIYYAVPEMAIEAQFVTRFSMIRDYRAPIWRGKMRKGFTHCPPGLEAEAVS